MQPNNLWNSKLQLKSYTFFAIRHYKTYSNHITWAEFLADIRLLNRVARYFTLEKDNNKSILNVLVTLGNVFSPIPLSRLLFYAVKEQYHSNLKTYLLFLKRLPNIKIPEAPNLSSISINTELLKVLKAF